MDVHQFGFHFEQVQALLNIVTVVSEGTTFPCQLLIVGHDHSSFPSSGEMFALTKAETADIAESSCPLALVDTSMGLGTIFDDIKTMISGEFEQWIHVGNDSIEVHDNYGSGSGRDLSAH